MLLVTGFPGFITSQLLPRLLAADPDRRATCVVQDVHAGEARRALDSMEARAPGSSARVRLVEGDITAPGMGLATRSGLAAVTDVWHLAGVYDTVAPRPLAERVNVAGTRHVLDLAAELPRLRRVHHISTCYVSGDHPGVFREEDLDVGQGFHSVYDETKFLAEAEVRKAAAGGLPVTVYRPASVVGDSRTGWTQKYDGPYFLFRLLLRQPAALALVPRFSDPSRAHFDIVPVDYLVAVLSRLAVREDGVGTTYQVTDPENLTVADIVAAAAAATGRRVVPLPLPLSPVRRLAGLPGVRRLVQIPA
ncbi:MAG TPA: SDR family oxidoreductase, partial [Actinomycetes bacterium]